MAAILVFVCLLCGCMGLLEDVITSTCDHEWAEVDCTMTTYCVNCGIDNPDIPSTLHKWIAEDCTLVAFCENCGKESTEVVNKEHTFMKSTCLVAGKCMYCNVRNGEPLGHDWLDATCKKAKSCSRCKKTEGAKGDHKYLPATCTDAEKCEVCGKWGEAALGHDYVDFSCVRCGEVFSVESIKEFGWYLNEVYDTIETAVGTIKDVTYEIVESSGGLFDTHDFEIRISRSRGNVFWVEEHKASMESIIASDKFSFDERVQAFVDLLEHELEIIRLAEQRFPGAKFEIKYFDSGYEQEWWGERYWSRSYLCFNNYTEGKWYMYEPDQFLFHYTFDDDMDKIYRAVSARIGCELRFHMFSDRYDLT